MKSGLCAYVYALKEAPSFFEIKALNYVNALEKASKLGFKGVGGIIRTKDMDDASITRLRETAESASIEIAEFITMVGDDRLSDKKKEVREAGIKFFRDSARMASELGAKIINTQSQTPFPYEREPSEIWGEAIIKVNVPYNLDWNKIWERYVEAVGKCADIAHEERLLWAIEPHPFQTVDNTNMALKIMEDVGSNALGVCFDTAQSLISAELPSISIYKLRNHIFHTHISDNLGSLFSPRHLTPGRGRIGWDEVLKALKAVGYDYFLTLEISDEPLEMLDEVHIKGMTFLREVAEKQGIKIE